jgi:hypothetical protein
MSSSMGNGVIFSLEAAVLGAMRPGGIEIAVPLRILRLSLRFTVRTPL